MSKSLTMLLSSSKYVNIKNYISPQKIILEIFILYCAKNVNISFINIFFLDITTRIINYLLHFNKINNNLTL